MSFNVKQNKEKLLFIPLGGSGEIGMNMNLYHYKGKWIILDCGAGFADDYIPGVDMLVPDISFLQKHKDDILGIVLTHAHEDHLGGVQYLYDELSCPIYTTKFTGAFLKKRLRDFAYSSPVDIKIIEEASSFKLGPFAIECIGLTHSAPEMQAVMIRTEAGNVLHTGDWKFDHDPLVGAVSDEPALKKCGDEGVLALVCDSTNVFNPGVSGSEGDLKKSLLDIINGCSKMVVVTTFASNLARLYTLIEIASKVKRRVVIAGRSIHRVLDAAIEAGYNIDKEKFVDERDMGRFKREELMVIATGCQGEPLATISKVASESHQNIKLAKGDTIIFSSKIIPGNEKKIFRLFNIFVKKEIEVITEKDHFVHVSGHPAVEELKHMYELVRPQVSIPVHGELVHMHEHARLAKSWGTKTAIQVENGIVVELNKAESKIVGKVESGYLAIDGNYLLPIDSPVIRMRRKIRESGIIIVTVILNNDGHLATAPIISFPGCLDKEEDAQLIHFLKKEIHEAVESMKASRRSKVNMDRVDNIIRSTMRRHIKTEVGKTPIIEVNVERVN